jgi:outer membrane protein OmpA-like peptidoglycan-associated protein
MIKSVLAFGLILLLLPLAAGADDVSGKLGSGLEFGTQKMLGGQRDYSNIHYNISAHIRYGLAPHWSLELGYKGGWSHPGIEKRSEDAGFSFPSTLDLYNVFHEPRLGVLYHFTPKRSLSPYAQVSVGMIRQYVVDRRKYAEFKGPFIEGYGLRGYDEDGKLQVLDGWDFVGFAGLGLEWFMTPNWAWNMGARLHFFPTNKLDSVGMSNPYLWGKGHVDANNAMLEAQLGFTIFFGDRAEPIVPIAPVKPVAKPTALSDRDGDGIYDHKDQCPDNPEDFDGFQDADGCPDPDNDGDGVLDVKDQCPNTPRGTVVNAKGCPKTAPKPERPAIILKGVNFNSDSSELSPRARVILTDVAKTLSDYSDIRIEVFGHTDDQNSFEYNMELSKARASAVKEYLASQGIDGARITTMGFGERKPIASNDTPEGMAQNRRVEIKIKD